MVNPQKFKRIGSLLFNLSMLTIAAMLALLMAMGGWQTSFAQVTDWCGQPNILWCSSFEETNGGNSVFGYGVNLPTGNSYNGNYGWYQSPGGFVDRNDSQYNAGVNVTAGLSATIKEASTTIPARSGEINTKRFVDLNADTTFAISNINPSLYPNEIDRNAGIFLSRKTEGGGITLTSSFTQGLYYSSWYYFPRAYSSTTTANNNLMVMEFMVQSDEDPNNQNNPTTWRRPWTIHLQGKSGGKMSLRVDEWSGTLLPPKINGIPNPIYTSRQSALIQHNSSPLDVPINKWVHLEVFYKYAPYTGEVALSNSYRGVSNGGQVIIYQDGVEIYRFDNVATAISTTDTLVSNHWIVTAYAHKSEPRNFNFYVDDSAISTVRLSTPREMILSGGDFNTANWRIDDTSRGTFTVDAAAGLSVNNPNAAKIEVTNPDPNNLNLPAFIQKQKIEGGIRAGTPYILRFTAKSNVTRTIRALLQHDFYNDSTCQSNNCNYEEYWSSGEFTISPTSQNFVYVITPTALTNTPPYIIANPAPWAIAESILVFKVGKNVSTVWIDNVSLLPKDELLRNGDFSENSNGSPWKVGSSSFGTFTIVSTNSLSSTNNLSAAQIQITNAPTISVPALYQVLSATLDGGVTYSLNFTARASADRTMSLAIQNTGWTTLAWQPCGTISLKTYAQNYVCTFSWPISPFTSRPETNPVLNFLLGGNQGSNTIWIDNVSLARSQ